MPPSQSSARFVPGDVIRYIPKDGHHCRQATAIVYEDGCAVDTFWGLERWNSGHVLRDTEIEGAELLFKLADYRPLGAHYDNKLEEWLTYAPADRQRVGSQHQWQSTYFVRVGAQPDLDTQIANACKAVEEAEHEILSAQRRVEWRKEDLARLEAARVG